MRKRNFAVSLAVGLGVGLPSLVLPLASLFGLMPNRALNRASGYVRDVLEMVNENYVDPSLVEDDALAHSAIHGMVESLDPHSEFLEAKDNQDLEEDLSGEFGGVGLQVEVHGGKVVVIEAMAGTPADRAGIRRGDEIVNIDGRSVGANVGMDDIVDRLRGKPHTSVAVGLFRPTSGRHLALTLEREIIKVESVTDVRVLDHDVGYILITEFSEHTGEQFADAVDGLLKKNINSLIIDLRNNPGGLLESAVEVAEPFFRKGEIIVYTQGRKPADREDFRSESTGDPLDLPVAVLINQDTASAAEIVTGALKDTGRAVIVGERSFGKGSVQSIFPLRNGEGLRLTTAKYYTPSGVSINEKGIAPQVEVVMTPAEDDNLRQQVARSDIRDSQQFALRFGFAPVDDRQLDAALAVLNGIDVLDSQAPQPGAGKAADARPPGPTARRIRLERAVGGISICGVPPAGRG